jgi:hypothetical protein
MVPHIKIEFTRLMADDVAADAATDTVDVRFGACASDPAMSLGKSSRNARNPFVDDDRKAFSSNVWRSMG